MQIQPSHNIKFQVLLRLGLNTGKDSADYQGLTFIDISPCVDYSYIKVLGFVSKQDEKNLYKMVHTKFSLKI